ncbi:MAG: hypothetical protein IT374_24435 [Polyangiaceae bacterium]|nr:hypothetical protein [Polyangiaceae bacterium]
MRAPLPYLSPALALVLVTGCASKPAKAPTRTLPEIPSVTAPTPPEARPATPPTPPQPSVELRAHKSREVPDLRGKLVALPHVASDWLGERFDHDLTVYFVDKGVSRLLPGAALAVVGGVLDRQEGAASKSGVKLTAPLASLSLVSRASGADYVLYGKLGPEGGGPQGMELPYQIAPEELKAYTQAYGAYVATLDRAIRDTRSACEGADVAPSSDEKGVEAVLASMRAQQFASRCQLNLATMDAKRRAARAPEALVEAAKKQTTRFEPFSTRLGGTLRLLDGKTDELIWIGIVTVTAPDGDAASALLARRVIDELSKGWPAEPAAPEPPPKAKTSR